MKKKLSDRLRIIPGPGLNAGQWVEVKSKEEILASLDANGNLDGMPFMPEMLKFCGQRLRVHKRAHKTCDYSQGVMQARRVPSAVHLEGARCNGEAHGNCQAECLLFWKEAWVRPIDGPMAATTDDPPTAPEAPRAHGCSEARLHTVTTTATSPEPVYSCQTTQIIGFSTGLRGSELDQYVEAYTSGNVKLREMLAPLVFRAFDRLTRTRLGASGRLQKAYDIFQKIRGGIPYPNRPGRIADGEKTPRGEALNLQPGEYVRVKSFNDILATVNREGLNRGLLFSQELVPYCGKVFKVHSRVSRIIDERNGKMLEFKNDCIILEDVVCQARYNAGQSFCPRANYPYWRELWLERIPLSEVPADLAAQSQCSGAAACTAAAAV